MIVSQNPTVLERRSEFWDHKAGRAEDCAIPRGHREAVGHQVRRSQGARGGAQAWLNSVTLVGLAGRFHERGQDGPRGTPAGGGHSPPTNEADVPGNAILERLQRKLLLARAQRRIPRTAPNPVLPEVRGTSEMLEVEGANGHRRPPVDDTLHSQPASQQRRRPTPCRQRTLSCVSASADAARTRPPES